MQNENEKNYVYAVKVNHRQCCVEWGDDNDYTEVIGLFSSKENARAALKDEYKQWCQEHRDWVKEHGFTPSEDLGDGYEYNAGDFMEYFDDDRFSVTVFDNSEEGSWVHYGYIEKEEIK